VRVSNRSTTMVVAAVLGTGALLGGAHSRADDKSSEPSSIDELKKENRQLKAQLQASRSALGEAAELDRQREKLLSRAAKGLPVAAAPESAASAPSLAEAPEAPSLPRGPGRASGAPSLPAPKKPAAPVTGTLRGKVNLPAGEPVAYVYVENVFSPPVRGERVAIEQVRKQFVPNWAVIQRGTTVQFPNNDKIYHNVFSQSSGNTFDLGLYNSASAAKSHTFSEPGAVDIYCNIHPQMAASILVVPNRYFAKVKSNGGFEIPEVPVGRRKVVAWSPGSKLHVQWVEVEAGAPVELAFGLEARNGAHKNKNGQQYGSYQ
jgi:plastocyanin